MSGGWGEELDERAGKGKINEHNITIVGQSKKSEVNQVLPRT
jgi:hypothetical protein